MRLKDQWPAAAFASGLFAVTLTLLIAHISDAQAWCSAEDKSVAVCLREWASASGNILAVIVALLAAWIAYRQFRTSARQAELPLIERRIEITRNVRAICSSVGANMFTITSHIPLFGRAISEGAVFSMFNVCLKMLNAYYELGKNADELDKLKRSNIMDFDLGLVVYEMSSVVIEVKMIMSGTAFYFEQMREAGIDRYAQRDEAIEAILQSELYLLSQQKDLLEVYKEQAIKNYKYLEPLLADDLKKRDGLVGR
jgi:hypothetical protein